MPGLSLFILLVRMAVSVLAQRPSTPVEPRHHQTAPRVLTPAECRLLFMPSPSRSLH